MPQNTFFSQICDLLVSQKMTQTLFSTLHPLSLVIFATVVAFFWAFVLLHNSSFNFHRCTRHEATPTQKLARKWRCNLSQLLARKITKGIHSCKPASLNRPIAELSITSLILVLNCYSCFIPLFFVFREKKKKEAELAQASSSAPSQPVTRKADERAEKRREAVRRSVQKHREKLSLEKRQQVNEKRMAYYYRMRAERKAKAKKSVHIQTFLSFCSNSSSEKTEKSIQTETTFPFSCCCSTFKKKAKSVQTETPFQSCSCSPPQKMEQSVQTETAFQSSSSSSPSHPASSP